MLARTLKKEVEPDDLELLRQRAKLDARRGQPELLGDGRISLVRALSMRPEEVADQLEEWESHEYARPARVHDDRVHERSGAARMLEARRVRSMIEKGCQKQWAEDKQQAELRAFKEERSRRQVEEKRKQEYKAALKKQRATMVNPEDARKAAKNAKAAGKGGTAEGQPW